MLETSIRTGTDALTALGAAIELSALDDAVFRLRAVGVTTISIPDYLSSMITTRLLGPGDVVIAVTDQYGTPLATLADSALVVGGAPLPAQMAAAGSRLAQLVVIVALVAAIVLRDSEWRRRAERAGIDLPDIS